LNNYKAIKIKHFLFSFHQEFKVFLLCLAVLVVATSAATVCKCEDKKVNKTDELIFKYSCHCNCYTL